tara:strand:- start:507 stop:1784 length:1278 start_codon:yes stop_codon:yes gene_type:complete
MKKITLLMSLLFITVGFSQDNIQDFEAAESVFGPFGGAAVELVPDPVAGGNRGQVAMLTSSAAGEIWQGTNVALLSNLDLTTDITITIDAYSLSPLTFAPKALGGVAGAPNSVSSATHTGSGWETITVSFDESLDNTAAANGEYSSFAIHYLWDTTAAGFLSPAVDRVIYVDNIVGVASTNVTAEPVTTANPPISRDAGDVVSIYSDAYTDVALGEIDPNWSPAVVSTIVINGDNFWKLTSCDFFAVTQYSGIDLSEMEMMHIDYWTPDNAGAPINIKLVDTENTIEEVIVLGNSVSETWTSVEIDLSTVNMDISNITQILYDPTNEGQIHYVDNFYFYKAPTASVDDFATNSVKMYPNPAKGFVNFSSASNEVLVVAVYDMLGKEVLRANAVQSQLNISSLNPGMYFVNMTQGTNVSTKKLLVN